MISLNKSRFIYLLIIVGLFTTGFNFLSNNDEIKNYNNFSIYDYNNKLHSLESFTDKKGIVLLFISTNCPVSNAYNSRMENLHKEFGDNFNFVGINSNKAEDIKSIKKHAEENNLSFTILKDINNVIADKFEASSTPEIYVLNNQLNQIYHGRIDDSRKIDDVEKSDLKNSLVEIQSGKEVSVKKTKAFGCSIKRINK